MSKEIEIKNPATMSNVNLRAYAKVIGVDFTEDVSHNDLKKAVGLKNKELKEAQGGSKENPKTSNKGVFYYWLKDDTYVDDNPEKSERLLTAGLYRIDRRLPRLNGQPKIAVEMWEGEIPARSIEVIAKSKGLSYDASADVDFNEVLESIVNEVDYKKLAYK